MDDVTARGPAWRWRVCALLLLATALSYVDRQTFSATSLRITHELRLSAGQYGTIEAGFSLAFAAGSVLFGVLADRLGPRALYPFILAAWSAAGALTATARSAGGLLACRAVLGLFESGHWPCALITVQRVLAPRERTMGNGLLQSGSSLGAIATPLLVQRLLDAGHGWRVPFVLVGVGGSVWAVLWLATVGRDDLGAPGGMRGGAGGFGAVLRSRRFLVLVAVVALINSAWQLMRAWLPLFLHEARGYPEAHANYFSSLYYVATDLGALAAGLLVSRLARRGVGLHAARRWAFLACALCALAAWPAALLPRGPALLATLLLVGFGLLGVFPSYYSLAQELSARHQGKVNGALGLAAWIATAFVQRGFGRFIDRGHAWDRGLALAGTAPVVALAIVLVFWGRS